MKFHKEESGFTLVELLIVMAIIAILVGITIAGLGYAMRRSRNIARMSAMSNLERSLQSYYSDYLQYPVTEVDAITNFIDSDGELEEYLEGSWEAPGGSVFYYNTDDGTGSVPIYFTVCVNQEQSGGAIDSYNCTGSGIGQGGLPSETNEVPCDDGTPAEGGQCGFYSEFDD
jgi:prepilin-type N-terminal cleavage/methylation domain-containing protein